MNGKQFDYTYKDGLSIAINNSQTYKGIRFYKFGETYLHLEKDIECKFPFDRICVDFTTEQTKKYIDDNIDFNFVELYVNKLITDEMNGIEKEINILKNKFETLKMIKLTINER